MSFKFFDYLPYLTQQIVSCLTVFIEPTPAIIVAEFVWEPVLQITLDQIDALELHRIRETRIITRIINAQGIMTEWGRNVQEYATAVQDLHLWIVSYVPIMPI